MRKTKTYSPSYAHDDFWRRVTLSSGRFRSSGGACSVAGRPLTHIKFPPLTSLGGWPRPNVIATLTLTTTPSCSSLKSSARATYLTPSSAELKLATSRCKVGKSISPTSFWKDLHIRVGTVIVTTQKGLCFI